VLKPEVLAYAIPAIVVPVMTSVVTTVTLSARAVPSVEGTTVETTGITFGG